MSYRGKTFGGVNIHQAASGTKPARSGKVEVEVPATLSEAKRLLAASYRRAGFSSRQAALKVAEVVAQCRAKERRAA